jgi:hypothetical protein
MEENNMKEEALSFFEKLDLLGTFDGRKGEYDEKLFEAIEETNIEWFMNLKPETRRAITSYYKNHVIDHFDLESEAAVTAWFLTVMAFLEGYSYRDRGGILE